MHRPTLSLFALMGLLGGGLLATSTVCGQVPSFGDHCGGIIPFVDDDPWFPYALPTATRSDAHRMTERSSSWRFYASGCDPVYDEAVYGTHPDEVAVSVHSQEEVATQVADTAQASQRSSEDEYVDFPYELTYDDDPPVASDDEYAGEDDYDYEYEYGAEETDVNDDDVNNAYDGDGEGGYEDDYDYEYEYDYEYDGYEEYEESEEPRDQQYSVDDDYEYGSIEDGRNIADVDAVSPTPVDDAAEAYRYYDADIEKRQVPSSNNEATDGPEEAGEGEWEGGYDYEYDYDYDYEYEYEYDGESDEDYEYEGAYEYDGDTGAAPADLSSGAEDSDDEYEDFPYELTYDDMPTESPAVDLPVEELVCLLSDLRERVACRLRELRMEESAQRAHLIVRGATSQLAATLPRVLSEMASNSSSESARTQVAQPHPSVARPVGSVDAGEAMAAAKKARREARLRLALLLDRVGESLQRVSRQMMLELAREDSDRLVR